MPDTSHAIPAALLANLEKVPKGKPVVLLLRHSVREKLPCGSIGVDQEITADGRRIAIELGEKLKGRLRSLRASPTARCIQTAEAIAAGANLKITVPTSNLLGVPGAYIADEKLAHKTWMSPGTDVREVIRKVCKNKKLAGMRDSDEAAWFLVKYMFSVAGDTPGIHIFVSHDAIVMPTAARIIGEDFQASDDDFPAFLDGVFFWKDEKGVRNLYHNYNTFRKITHDF
ncbi:MAG: histidine phosphatase family protein [Puniceicoccales bacterium]|jgi:hypothetical protein|nr:histidine phosphatase family protein [Puniceicoccales bacterium]